jgi:DNA helicase-2/ATP-dependent DNA helicase PcrA
MTSEGPDEPAVIDVGQATAVDLQPALAERLGRLSPDQRAAATAPPGPILCVAPAGSGKTTTLVARIAWLVDGGVDPGSIAAITFNRRAAEELGTRLAEALTPLGLARNAVRVRTFHALGLEILREAGQPVGPLADRSAILAGLVPEAGPAAVAEFDTAISRLKVDLGVSAAEIAGDPGAGPIARTFVAYEQALAANGALDFDDLVIGALRALDSDSRLLGRWRGHCAHILVDEVQDVDQAQLGLALMLAAPGNRIFLVGDDDQSIYGWRLADVRRIFSLAARLPGLERHHLVTNFRCPKPVVERSVRLVARNRERFAKTVRPGPDGAGRLILAPDGGDDDERIDRAFDTWPADGSTRAVLARTNAELVPASAIALDREIPFRAQGVRLPLDDPMLDSVMATIRRSSEAEPATPLAVLIGRLRAANVEDRSAPAYDALLGWAGRFPSAATLAVGLHAQHQRLARLRRDGALLTLATAHAVKGLEFDHVIVLMDADRFPSRRALDDAVDPIRALEEERRLAYVAWTRARKSLTLLYDPAAPSQFLLEAFDRKELGLRRRTAGSP